MDDAHAAPRMLERLAQELRDGFPRFNASHAVQVEVSLGDPVTAAQLAQELPRETDPQIRGLLAGFQGGVRIE